MAGSYRETWTEHQVTLIEIEIEGADSEEHAQSLVNTFGSLGEGRWIEQGAMITITHTIQDSDSEPNDDGEWEEDEENE